jgi:outer membrane protein assembly factor BamB
VDDPQQQRDCLLRVLALNPDNRAARQRLGGLDPPQGPAEPPPAVAPQGDARVVPQAGAPVAQQRAGPSSRRNRRYLIAAVGSAVLLLLSALGVASLFVARGVLGRLAQSEDAAMYRANPQHTGVYRTRGVRGDPQVLWRHPVGKVNEGSSPTVVDGVLYMGNEEGEFYAIDVDTLLERWVLDFHLYGPIRSSPAVYKGVVYFGGSWFRAVDAGTGQERWAFGSESFDAAPTLAGGVVYAASEYGHVYALDARSGREKWAFEARRPVVFYSPAVDRRAVYVAGLTASLYALDIKTGAEIWRFDAMDDWSTPAAVADGIVYAGNSDECMYAIDARTGQEKWRRETGDVVLSSPAIADGIEYFGSWAYIYALDARTGETVWRYTSGSAGFESSPSIADGIVYIGDWDGKLFALDARTGEEVWTLQFDAPILYSPAIDDGTLYFWSLDGNLWALSEAR